MGFALFGKDYLSLGELQNKLEEVQAKLIEVIDTLLKEGQASTVLSNQEISEVNQVKNLLGDNDLGKKYRDFADVLLKLNQFWTTAPRQLENIKNLLLSKRPLDGMKRKELSDFTSYCVNLLGQLENHFEQDENYLKTIGQQKFSPHHAVGGAASLEDMAHEGDAAVSEVIKHLDNLIGIADKLQKLVETSFVQFSEIDRLVK
jgi:hypothetical protein